MPKQGGALAAFRDHVIIANEAADRLTNETLKRPEELKEFLDQKFSAAKERYEDAVTKHHKKAASDEE